MNIPSLYRSLKKRFEIIKLGLSVRGRQPSEQELPKLFNSIVLNFASGRTLRFDLFDHPFAQKWACLVNAYCGNPWHHWLHSPRLPLLQVLQEEVNGLLVALADPIFLKTVERKNGILTKDAIRRIYASSILSETADPYRRKLQYYLRDDLKSLERATAEHSNVSVTGLSFRPDQKNFSPYAYYLDLNSTDLRHFRKNHLPGGIRLDLSLNPPSALVSARASYGQPPSLPLRYSLRFRLDLEAKYSPTTEWESHQEVKIWARHEKLNIPDLRSWKYLAYVGQLNEKELALISSLKNRSIDWSLRNIQLVPSTKPLRKLESTEAKL